MKPKTIQLIIIYLIALITITFIATSQVGIATSGKQVTFKDNTGYYKENANYEIGEKVLFPFLKITDLIIYGYRG